MERRSVHLPEEIIEEILLRLAVKSLLRFRCVSKSYRSLIDSKRFIRTHHQKSTKDSSLAHHRVLLFSNSLTQNAREVFGCSLLSFLDESDDNASRFNLPASVPRRYKIYIVGCCNGLVCIQLRIIEFILWNPSTRVSKKLPHIGNINIEWYDCMCVGFGWDETSDDYKVIMLYCVDDQTICKLYNLKNDSWKKIDACNIHHHYFPGNRFGKLAKGKLYWECNDVSNRARREIVAFDLKRDVLEIVEQPCYSEGYFYQCLGTFGEWLAVVCCNYKGYKEIWAMKEYNGVKESWVKVMAVYDYDKYDIWTSPCVDAFYKGAKGEILLMNMGYGNKFLR